LPTLPSQKGTVIPEENLDNERSLLAFRERLAASQTLLPELANQLRVAVQQTEQAVLEISEKFMNIASRARQQLQASSAIVGTLEQGQHAGSGSAVGGSAKAEKAISPLARLAAETESLGQDINGIITSLQFQDITRQEIEKVIGRMEQFQHELNDIAQGLEPEQGSVPGHEGLQPGGKRGEHV